MPLPEAAAAARAIFSLLPGRSGECKAALRQPIASAHANLPQSRQGREPTRGQDGCRGAALACLGHSLKENSSFHVANGKYAPCEQSPGQASGGCVYGRAGDVLLPILCAAPVRGRAGAGKAAGVLPLLRNGVFPGGDTDNLSNSQLTNLPV